MATLKAVTLFRVAEILSEEMDRDLPFTIPLVFLRIASAGSVGVDQETVQKDLSVSSSSMSRASQTLSDRHYLKEREGLKLVERVMDAMDNRRRLLRMTPKGERLIARCLTALEKSR